jgi:membrane protein implicated in regulation of membrane protease activity
MQILWWHWLVLGLLLAVAELATPGGFYIIFFGVGALVVGALTGMDMAGPVWMQIVLFGVFSVILLVLFRARLLKITQVDPQIPPVDTLVGEIGIVSEGMAPDHVGTVQLRGANWSARNASAGRLVAGARCQVLRVDGLMLYVGPEGGRS